MYGIKYRENENASSPEVVCMQDKREREKDKGSERKRKR